MRPSDRIDAHPPIQNDLTIAACPELPYRALDARPEALVVLPEAPVVRPEALIARQEALVARAQALIAGCHQNPMVESQGPEFEPE